MVIKRYLLFLAIFATIFNIVVLPALAQDKPLETNYPEVPNATTPTTTTTSVPKYVEYLFYFLVWGSGILALLALIYGGFKYITALGNPDKLRDAKDRIISALLGLAIVVGSYLILWQINPQFLTFNLPPLKPMINSISPGVWACKAVPAGATNFEDPLDLWVLEKIYKTDKLLSATDLVSPMVADSMTRLVAQFALQGLNLSSISDPNNITIRKAIKKKIDELLVNVNKYCYRVSGEGPVKADFNDKIEYLWFIPETIYGATKDGTSYVASVVPYGAAVFDGDDFTGLGNIFFRHMFTFARAPEVVYLKGKIKASSIKPFKYYQEDLSSPLIWTVKLYAGEGYNYGFLYTDPYQTISSIAPYGPYYADVSADGTQFIPKAIKQTDAGVVIPPQSMKIEGEALVILYKNALKKVGDHYEVKPTTIGTGDNAQTGYYFQIFYNNDNNLLDDYNIVYWDRCPAYTASAEELAHCDVTITTVMGAYGTLVAHGTVTAPDCCAQAAADSIMVLSNMEKAY
jgi:hypothetical protein